jgi:hypothetical protein
MQDQIPIYTWAADEIRAGTRKIPGFAGHVPGVRNTVGCSYGAGSADALGNPDSDAVKAYPSAILRNRHDGYTIKNHPDHPFNTDYYKANTANLSRIIPGYAGHCPDWQHAYGMTAGKYGSAGYTPFTTTTRRLPSSRRERTATPKSILDLPAAPAAPPARRQLYSLVRGYIPGTTLYAPAMRERFSHTYGTLTRDAFAAPVPQIPHPLAFREDGKSIPHLELPSGYAGTIPRVLPQFIPPPPTAAPTAHRPPAGDADFGP